MALVSISDLTFAYEGSYDNIFNNVSFQFDTDWKLGFCGRNGRGKTTFLKLLMEGNRNQSQPPNERNVQVKQMTIAQPEDEQKTDNRPSVPERLEYTGTISSGQLNFEYFPYAVAESDKNTLAVISGIVPEAELWQIEKELYKMEVNPDTLERPFSTLSGGERTKVLLAGLFLRENSFLLIDEPTNHLDMKGRESLARYLKSKSSFILVSHDRDFLDECVDHVLSINKTNIDVQAGNFSSWFRNKQLQDDFEIAENLRLKKDIKRLETAARQSAAWADKVESTKKGKGAAKLRKKGQSGIDSMAYMGEKSRRMQQRRKNLENRQGSALEEKSKLLKNIETADKLKIHPLEYHTSRLLELESVSIAYGEREIFRNISLTLSQGERIALLGGNGSGKSSLINLIMGNLTCTTGQVRIGSRLVISYVPQDASFLSGNLSDYAKAHNIDESLFKAILSKLDFSRVQFDKDMRDYSSGQKKKVLIAGSLCQRAHVYIWDEPLNYIDVLSRIQIEELLAEYQPTMIFVEHDRAFCRNVATSSVVL